MATKPGIIPRIASTVAGDPLRVVSVPSGKQDIGFDVGEAPPAQWINWLFLYIYYWIVWLDAFESDPHVWSQQQSFNKGIACSNTTVDFPGVVTTGNNTYPGIISTGGASNADGAWLRGTGTGSGAFCQGLGAGGAGVRAVGGPTSGPGVLAAGTGTGPGLVATGGAGAPGLTAAGGTNQSGAVCTGNGNAPALLATGGAAGVGVRAVSVSAAAAVLAIPGTGLAIDAQGAISATDTIQTTADMKVAAIASGAGFPTSVRVQGQVDLANVGFAWGRVDAAGNLPRGRNVKQVVRIGAGHFTIKMHGTLGDDVNTAVWVQPCYMGALVVVNVLCRTFNIGADLVLEVFLFDNLLAPLDHDFSFGVKGE